MNQLRRLKQFLVEVWAELKKTTWPGKNEVYGTTFVVIVTVLICAAYLFFIDILLNQGIKSLMSAFGS